MEDLIARIGCEVVVNPEHEQRRREEDEKLVREVFSKVSVPGPGPSHKIGEGEEGEATSTVVTLSNVELDLKSLLPESTRAVVNAMSASLQPAQTKKAEASKSLGIKLVKKRM